jgi:FdhD protein
MPLRIARISKGSKTGARIWRVAPGGAEEREDHLATEEPLEIRLVQEGQRRTVAVTMRTPGADAELALGFLFAEGVITSREQVSRAVPCLDPENEKAGCDNLLEVELAEGVPAPELGGLDRHFFTSSACGVCGKVGLETLKLRVSEPVSRGPEISPEILSALPVRLREAQGIFDATGGLHAAGLFDAEGNLLAAREDVGRHNALDKLMGWALLQGLLPLANHIVMVSGRSSYEILQKCLVAGVPVVCAVSAPSSLAVDLAATFGITLVGFLRGDRFNVYSGIERIAGAVPAGRVRRERSLLRTV